MSQPSARKRPTAVSQQRLKYVASVKITPSGINDFSALTEAPTELFSLTKSKVYVKKESGLSISHQPSIYSALM